MDDSDKVVHAINKGPASVELLKWEKLIKKHDKCRMVEEKYKVVKKSIVDQISHRRTGKTSTKHYLTEGRIRKIKPTHLPPEKDNAIGSLGAVSVDEKINDIYKPPEVFEEPKFEKQELKYSDKVEEDTLKVSSSSIDIRQRVFVPGPVMDADGLKGITDVDEKYFAVVKPPRNKWNLGVGDYLTYLRETFRVRLQIGYVFDEIYKLNEQAEIEESNVNRLQAKLKKYKMAFDEFLAEDHNYSMKPLSLLIEEAAKTTSRRKVLTNRMNELSKLQFSIYSSEDIWKKTKLCEEFILSFFSILSGNHSTYYYELKYGALPCSTDESEQTAHDSMTSLLQFATPKVIVNIDDDLVLNDPLIFFEIFTSLEQQCLDYLTFTELLEKPNMAISMHLSALTAVYDREIGIVKQTIKQLENVIAFMEQNNSSLEAHVNKLINGLFKKTFAGAEESILINEYLKQTYTRCISGGEAAVSSQQMMNALSIEYSRIHLEIDSLPSNLLKKHVNKVQHRETVKLQIARNARRKIHELEILTEQMFRLFKPIDIKNRRKLMHRSFRPTVKRPSVYIPEELTQEQKDYLHLFKDFCPFTDNVAEFLKMRQELRKESTLLSILSA